MNDCMANVSLFIIRTAYGPEAEKINLLAGLLQAAGLQGEVKVAFGVKAPDNCLGLGAISQLFLDSPVIAGIQEYQPVNTLDGKKMVLKERKRQGKNWLKWLKSWSSLEKGKAGFSYFPSEDLHLWYLKPIK